MSDNDIKAFEFSSVKAKGDVKAHGEFTINGETYYVRALKDAHLAYLVHHAKSTAPDKVITAVLNFMERALLEESAERFEALVLGDPGLEMSEVVSVFEHVLTLVTANPTGSPKPSSARRRTTGSGSPASARSKASAH